MRGSPRLTGAKPKDLAGTTRRLLSYFQHRRAQFASIVAFAVLSTAFTVIGPRLLGMITTRLFDGFIAKYTAVALDKPTPSVDFIYIGRMAITLIALYGASSFCGYVQQYQTAGISQRIVFDLRQEVVEKLSRLPLRFYDSRTHGEIMSRVTNDIDNISTTLQQSLTQLITSVCTIVGVLIMMLTISPLLSLITIVTLPLSFLGVSRITRRSQKYFSMQQAGLGVLNGKVEETYTGLTVVKAFGRERGTIGEFEKSNGRLCEASWKAQFVSGIVFPVMSFISNLGYVFVCVMGGVMAARRTLKLGDIQAFVQYSKQFTQPITQTANIANVLQSTVASAERVFEVLDEIEEEPDAPDAIAIGRPRGEVVFKDVSFGYLSGTPLMEGLSLVAKEGQTVAIVGPTGAGKTTLVNLLMRFYEINDGVISVDGVDIRALKRGELRKMFGMVLQETWMFGGSVRDNIAYGRKDASEKLVVESARAAHADHFIRALPSGYDTVLSEDASNISHGERQLITIARAILCNPKMLILDEATSSVDTRTEAAVQKAMGTLMKGRTSFVIAHRLSTIRNADAILVMNKGRIIEIGRHNELIAKAGFYADLYMSQFADTNRDREGAMQ